MIQGEGRPVEKERALQCGLKPSLEEPAVSYQSDYLKEKVHTQTFLELLDTGSNMTLISGDPKCHVAPY